MTRNGYDAPALTVLLKAKPSEVRDSWLGPSRQTARATSSSSSAWQAFRCEPDSFAHCLPM